MTDTTDPQAEPVNDMRELYAVQHAITDAGGTLTPDVHKAIDALRETWDRELRRAQAEAHQYRTALQGAARAAAAPSAPAARTAILRELASSIQSGDVPFSTEAAEAALKNGGPFALIAYVQLAIGEHLRRMAAKAQQPETQVLAAALDGLHTLIATSSRDWQAHRVDAWIWAVLCGWDCEQTEHDETCTHGALEETAAMHGWDADAVARARRYRAVVHAITEPAAVSQPGTEA